MGLEIDMLSVGDADAITLRHVGPDGKSFVAVIDGAYQENAYTILDIVKTYYGRSYIDLVVSTHPDQDHILGLIALLDLIRVDRVWVHDPSKHRPSSMLRAKRILASYNSSGIALLKSMDDLEQFIKLVDSKRIPREEPFAGLRYGPLFVVGPSVSFYEQMLNEIAVDEGFVQSTRLAQARETLSVELLEQYPRYAIDENNETAPSNNTSTIVWIGAADRKYLFTGDAGVQALDSARQSYNLSNLSWMQIPHHGSRRNLNSDLVDYLSPKTAYISAEGNIKHPSKAVVNALKRVNTAVYSTHKNSSLWHHWGNDVPGSRSGYVSAEPL